MSPPVLTPRIWSEIALLGTIWGGSFLAVKLALIELPVTTTVAHRVFWAALLLWAYILLRGLPLPKGARAWGALAVMGVLNNALPFSLMAWGQQFIETGLTAIFNAATAIFAVVVAAIVFRDERLTLRRALGVITAFAGVVITIGIAALANLDIRSQAQLVTLGGALSYACAAAWGRAFLGGIRPEVAATVTLTTASLILVPIAIWQHGPPALPSLTSSYIGIGFVSVIGTACAYLLYYRILARAGAGNAMLVTLIIPPIAFLSGALVLGEAIAPRAIAGFALIALGLIILDGRLTQKLHRRVQGAKGL